MLCFWNLEKCFFFLAYHTGLTFQLEVLEESIKWIKTDFRNFWNLYWRVQYIWLKSVLDMPRKCPIFKLHNLGICWFVSLDPPAPRGKKGTILKLQKMIHIFFLLFGLQSDKLMYWLFVLLTRHNIWLK